jgi:hypothetical protein
VVLYHYYERLRGPLLNLSDLPIDQAQAILNDIKAANNTFAAHRYDGYLERRQELEQLVRRMFVQKGGKPLRQAPHYFVVEACPWLETWYIDPAFVKLPVSALPKGAVSFTYGDMFPTFSPRVQDGREYRNKVYTCEEILPVIAKYGMPQQWNPGGEHGPERYIEAQVWCDISPESFLV